MKDLYSIYSIIVILWYIVSLFIMLYIYNACIKRHKSKNEKKIYEEKPKKISNAELSYLMYKKIIPEVITVSILDLVDRKFIIVENKDGEYYLKVNYTRGKLSQSDAYLLDVINRIIDGRKNISLTTLANYCTNKNNAKDFLISYEIYIKILRSENDNEIYFEQKRVYSTVNIYKNISYMLWLMSFVFTFYKMHNILGYLIIVISFSINELFLKSYKRTKEANDLYFDYIAYKNYLSDINNHKYDKKNINDYMMAGIILKVEDIDVKLSQNDFSKILNNAINKCVKKALDRK